MSVNRLDKFCLRFETPQRHRGGPKPLLARSEHCPLSRGREGLHEICEVRATNLMMDVLQSFTSSLFLPYEMRMLFYLNYLKTKTPHEVTERILLPENRCLYTSRSMALD